MLLVVLCRRGVARIRGIFACFTAFAVLDRLQARAALHMSDAVARAIFKNTVLSNIKYLGRGIYSLQEELRDSPISVSMHAQGPGRLRSSMCAYAAGVAITWPRNCSTQSHMLVT